MRNRGRLVHKVYVRAPGDGIISGRRPRVSVVIPCYNYARFLPDSVGSALSQSGVDPEVIVVDDASTDDSAAVAEGFAATDPRVTVVHHAHNTGHVIAFNAGLARATGEFIVRLDADDLLTPGALARAVALFDAFPSVGLVYGHPQHFTTEAPPVARTVLRGWRVWSGADWIAERCRRGVNCITTPEAAIRADVMRSVGGLDTRLRYAQDMEMWLRIAAVSDVGRIEGPDQALHRDHAASMSVTDGAGLILDLRERRTVFDVLFAGPGGQLSRQADLHAMARRTLAGEALELACHKYDRGHTDTEEVAGLVDFAEETYARLRELPQWRALERRRRVGPRWAPVFAASVLWRRARSDYRRYRWVRAGV
jgi:Glycosyl transferase family 2